MKTILLWGIALAGITCLCIYEHYREQREQRKKYGYTRREFRVYKKMISDSAYRTDNKKSPAKAELIQQPMFHHN